MASIETGRTDPTGRLGAAAARRGRRAVFWTAVCALLFHTLAVLWIWKSWGLGLRGGWLVWMDLPVSLLYLGARDGWLLALSLVLGGLQWALAGALLSKLIASLARNR